MKRDWRSFRKRRKIELIRLAAVSDRPESDDGNYDCRNAACDSEISFHLEVSVLRKHIRYPY